MFQEETLYLIYRLEIQAGTSFPYLGRFWVETKLFGGSFPVSNHDLREERNHFAMGRHHVSMSAPFQRKPHPQCRTHLLQNLSDWPSTSQRQKTVPLQESLTPSSAGITTHCWPLQLLGWRYVRRPWQLITAKLGEAASFHVHKVPR